jgi:protein TonB
MVAQAVPPPGRSTFPFRDLSTVARRNLTRGLAVSALAHAALLSAILVSQEREPALRLVRGEVEIIPHIPTYVPPVPRELPPPTTAAPPEEGEWELIERPVIEPPEIAVRNGHDADGREAKGSAPGPVTGGEPGSHALVETTELPMEAFVHFDEAPVPIHRPAPEYPAWARENGITGKVLLRVLVDQQGSVRRIAVVRGVKGLTEAAQDALREWRFRPATDRGRPVAVWVEIPVEFRLGG